MRPIALDTPRPDEFDPERLLAAPVVVDGAATTLSAVVDELEALLSAPAGGTGAADAAEERRRALAAVLGDGHESARGALLARTEQFCAFCDIPLLSDARVVRALPEGWFPRLAFTFGNLLPACAACDAARGERPSRDAGEGDAAERAWAAYAWPHRLAAEKGGDAGAPPLLPFRYELVETDWAAGQPRRRAVVPERELAAYREAYRRGGVSVRDGRVEVALGPEERRTVAVWVSATPGAGAEAVEAMLALTGQNRVVAAPNGSWVDRRMEMRTLALFRALDFGEMLERAWAEGWEDTHEALSELLRDAVEGTGFWGVWLWALRHHPGIQATLRDTLGGTAPTEWSCA